MVSRRTVTVIDAHAAGEPGRVIIDQHLRVGGSTMAQRLAHCEQHLEDLRRTVLREPRGYPALCAPLVLPPVEPTSDFGLVVLEQGGFRPMSGSNLICAVTALIDAQLVEVVEPLTRLRVDTAAGPVTVEAVVEGGRAMTVTFENVPSFAVHLDRPIAVPHYGSIAADVVFGGQFYVQAPASAFGLELVPGEAREIIRAGSALVNAAREQIPVRHPTVPGLTMIALPMIHTASEDPEVDGRAAVVLPNGAVDLHSPETWTGTLDRSPCGTGTCGRLAARHARGEMGVGDRLVHQSLLGTAFTGRILGTARVGDIDGIRPSITGRGWVTGYNRLVIDDDDPFARGFTLGDIWGTEPDDPDLVREPGLLGPPPEPPTTHETDAPGGTP